MANINRGEVSFEAEGTAWTLVFSINALCDLEDRTGRSVQDLNLDGALSMRLLRDLIWAGLRERHPAVTVEDAGRIATAAGMGVMQEKVMQAIVAAFPETAKGEAAAAAQGKRRR